MIVPQIYSFIIAHLIDCQPMQLYSEEVIASLATASISLVDHMEEAIRSRRTGVTSHSLADDLVWARAIFILLQNPLASESSLGRQLERSLCRVGLWHLYLS